MAMLGVAGNIVAAVLLPWAYYGDDAVSLNALPNWWLYFVAVLAQLLSGAPVLRGTASNRWRSFAICAGLTVVAVVAAMIVMLGYDEPNRVTGTAFPQALTSELGPGGPVAIISSLVTGAALAWRSLRGSGRLAPTQGG